MEFRYDCALRFPLLVEDSGCTRSDLQQVDQLRQNDSFQHCSGWRQTLLHRGHTIVSLKGSIKFHVISEIDASIKSALK